MRRTMPRAGHTPFPGSPRAPSGRPGVRCSPPPTPAPSTGRRPRAPARSWRTAPAPPEASRAAPRSRACPDARRGRSRIARTTPTARCRAGGGASARPSAPDALAASGCRPCRAPGVVHRAARPRHRRHRVPGAAVPGPQRPHHPPRVDPVGPPLPAAPDHLEARRVADHHPEILALQAARQPEALVTGLVHQHHADIPAGDGGGPLPRPPQLREQPVHLRSGASLCRPVLDASAGSPTARIQPVPLTCSAACTVVTLPPEGVVGQVIAFSFRSARGAAFRPPCHHMLEPPHSPAPNRPQRQTPARLMASGGRRRHRPGDGPAGSGKNGIRPWLKEVPVHPAEGERRVRRRHGASMFRSRPGSGLFLRSAGLRIRVPRTAFHRRMPCGQARAVRPAPGVSRRRAPTCPPTCAGRAGGRSRSRRARPGPRSRRPGTPP